MDKPHIPDAPGLAWRPRKNGWAAVWLARQDIAKKGFKPSTRQIAIFDQPPTEAQETDMRAACVKFQEEMYDFGYKQPKEFGGRLTDLIVAYQKDPDSPYHKSRHVSRSETDYRLTKIDQKFGQLKLTEMGARDFKRIYGEFRWPDGEETEGGRNYKSTAHKNISLIRMIFSFGAAFEVEKTARGHISECRRLRDILAEMAFEKGKARKETLSLRQCEDIIVLANASPFPSIALAQALQRSLGVRQKDVVGEWVPNSERGISAVTHHGKKWLRGLLWEEISSDLIVNHPMSKSRTGKILEFDLKVFPMVMAELEKIPMEKRFGPVVVCETTGRPWGIRAFREYWREFADAAGVPKNVHNMDSRAGAITEAIRATGGNLEAARKMAGHSDVKTTQGYSREVLESNNETAVIVANFRAKNGA